MSRGYTQRAEPPLEGVAATVQVEIKSKVQQDADSCGNRCGKSDPCQAGVWLDTHEVSEGETDAEGLDQSLEHNPERFVVAVEVADHAE